MGFTNTTTRRAYPATYVSMTEGCRRIGITHPTMRRLIRDGDLHAVRSLRDTRVWLVSVDDLDRVTRVGRKYEIDRAGDSL